MKKIVSWLFLISIFAIQQPTLFAQYTSHIRISLLTCTPGEELYSTFGHSGIRLYDSSRAINDHQDIVFNYGTFNFDDPGFYMKFIRGKLLYFVSAADFADFKDEYQSTNRGITEQVLNLSAPEKISLEHFLFNNIKEENKYYKYDFFFDNCTTRLRDIILKHKKNYPALKAVMPQGTRFRQAIHQYLDKNNKQWSKLGIDILLGVPTDAVMTTAQSQFLPENLMKAFDSSNDDRQLVLSSTNLYPIQNINEQSSLFTPMMIFGLLLVLITVLDLSKNKWTRAFLAGFDGLLFFLTGTIGILLIFMWLGTDHAMCKSNYNLLWAWPTHAIVAFFINNKKQWVKKYLVITAVGLVLVLLSWFFLPQQLNNALIIICLLLLFRTVRKYMAL